MARLARTSGVAFALAIAGWSQTGESFVFGVQSRETVFWRLSLATPRNEDRRDALVDLFGQAGCSAVEKQKVRGSKLPNVICTLPGSGQDTVIVGAHYDCPEIGEAAADNWSGTALLPSLYQDLRSASRKYTFVFAGLTGVAGAEELVKRYDERGSVCAFVDLDTLGLGRTGVRLDVSEQKLIQMFRNVGDGLKVRLYRAAETSREVPAHFEPFRKRRIPVLVVTAISPDLNLIPHSSADTLDLIQQEAYYETYSVVAGFLSMLVREDQR